MQLRKEAGIVLTLLFQVGVVAAGANTNARVKVDVLSSTDDTNVQLDRFEHPENGKFLQQAA